MARTKRQRKNYIDFSGGVQGFTSPLLLNENESPLFVNADIRRPGKLRKTGGFLQIGSGSGVGDNRGVFAWNKEDGSSELYQVFNENLYKYTGTASGFQTVGTALGATGSHPVEWAVSFINTGTGVGSAADTFIERLYISQGLDQGTIKFTTGTSISGVADIYAKHLEEYKGRIYAGNVKQGSNTYNTRVIFTDISSDDFPNANYFDDMGEPIKALKEFSGALFVFTENKVATWDEYSLTPLNVQGGTTNKETVQISENRLLWYNRGGVYMFAGGTESTLISRPVTDWTEAISDADAVTGGIDSKGRYNLYIGDVTVDGVAYSDVVLIYDVLINAWSVQANRPFKYWTLNSAAGVYEAYVTDPDNVKVYQKDVGYSLDGATQTTTYQTAKLYGNLDDVDNYKMGYRIEVVFKPTNVTEYLTVQYRVGGTGSWSNIEGTTNNVLMSGTDDIKIQELVLPENTRGKFIELKFSHSSAVSGFEIYGVNLIYDIERNDG